MSDDYGRDWLVGDDLDAACVESIKLELPIEAWSWTNVKCVMGKRDALCAALAADATQAGERWRAEREVLESATRWREAMRGLDALARTDVWGKQELAESRRLAVAQSEALLQLTSALDRLAALGEEAGE